MNCFTTVAEISGLELKDRDCGAFVVAMILAVWYERWATSPIVARAFRGITVAAAGLLVALAVKASRRLGDHPLGVPLVLATCAAIAWLHWPLLLALAVLTPASLVAVQWRRT